MTWYPVNRKLVLSSGLVDGIATIYGIEHAMYGEIVIFENGIVVWFRISDVTRSAVSFLEKIQRSKRAQK